MNWNYRHHLVGQHWPSGMAFLKKGIQKMCETNVKNDSCIFQRMIDIASKIADSTKIIANNLNELLALRFIESTLKGSPKRLQQRFGIDAEHALEIHTRIDITVLADEDTSEASKDSLSPDCCLLQETLRLIQQKPINAMNYLQQQLGVDMNRVAELLDLLEPLVQYAIKQKKDESESPV